MMEVREMGALRLEVSAEISAPHGFTGRPGGVSTGIFESLNIANKEGESEENVRRNFDILGNALGFDVKKCVLTRQTHSDIIRVVTAADCAGVDHRKYPECDGLVTNVPGLALVIFTADCTPVLLHDPVTGAVGAVHAGWRGTVQDIAGKAVAAMVQNFGCKPEDIRCAIGPNIAQCCFQTDADVPHALIGAYGRDVLPHIQKRGDKFYPDLKAVNALSLRNHGVRQIDRSCACTACRPDLYWSHRVTQGKRGSQGAVIVCP